MNKKNPSVGICDQGVCNPDVYNQVWRTGSSNLILRPPEEKKKKEKRMSIRAREASRTAKEIEVRNRPNTYAEARECKPAAAGWVGKKKGEKK